MNVQAYLVIDTETNIVENIVLWDGDTSKWQPHHGGIAVPNATTNALVWSLNNEGTDYLLSPKLGATDIGFTWNGSESVTNQPKPNPTDVTVETISVAASLLSKYAFTSEAEFQSSITEESKQNITSYLDALNLILENAQLAYDEGRAYSPSFPNEPAIFMLTPGGNRIPVDLRRFK